MTSSKCEKKRSHFRKITRRRQKKRQRKKNQREIERERATDGQTNTKKKNQIRKTDAEQQITKSESKTRERTCSRPEQTCDLEFLETGIVEPLDDGDDDAPPSPPSPPHLGLPVFLLLLLLLLSLVLCPVLVLILLLEVATPSEKQKPKDTMPTTSEGETGE